MFSNAVKAISFLDSHPGCLRNGLRAFSLVYSWQVQGETLLRKSTNSRCVLGSTPWPGVRCIMTSTASFRHMIYAQRWEPAENLQKARRDNTCRYMKSCTASNNNSSTDFNLLLKKEQLTKFVDDCKSCSTPQACKVTQLNWAQYSQLRCTNDDPIKIRETFK